MRPYYKCWVEDNDTKAEICSVSGTIEMGHGLIFGWTKVTIDPQSVRTADFMNALAGCMASDSNRKSFSAEYFHLESGIAGDAMFVICSREELADLQDFGSDDDEVKSLSSCYLEICHDFPHLINVTSRIHSQDEICSLIESTSSRLIMVIEHDTVHPPTQGFGDQNNCDHYFGTLNFEDSDSEFNRMTEVEKSAAIRAEFLRIFRNRNLTAYLTLFFMTIAIFAGGWGIAAHHWNKHLVMAIGTVISVFFAFVLAAVFFKSARCPRCGSRWKGSVRTDFNTDYSAPLKECPHCRLDVSDVAP